MQLTDPKGLKNVPPGVPSHIWGKDPLITFGKRKPFQSGEKKKKILRVIDPCAIQSRPVKISLCQLSKLLVTAQLFLLGTRGDAGLS